MRERTSSLWPRRCSAARKRPRRQNSPFLPPGPEKRWSVASRCWRPLGLKDVRLVLQAAERQSVPMPIASVLRDRFVTALARGYQDKDWSVVGRVAAEDAGLTRATHA